MKFKTHIWVYTNMLGLLSGLTFYFIGAREYYVALMIGLFTFIWGNVYGHFISKMLDKAIVDFVVKIFDKMMKAMIGTEEGFK